jgi:myo-inositol-1(or 4)-monophosphatase
MFAAYARISFPKPIRRPRNPDSACFRHDRREAKMTIPAAPENDIPDMILREIERTAVELASLAGTEIMAALGRTLEVRYKGVPGDTPTFRDPVSEVDGQVEVLIRARLAERFPEHDILGEEMDERPGRDHDFVWAVDPIDGTTNFVNGFPLYAASIGVLHRGRPVVGAVWCSTSHALRTGVYHARVGGDLCFDQEPLKPRENPAVRRRLAGEPQATPDADLPWDIRKTGSAAIECAFVAAGLLRVARFQRPNVWDVAGGIPLVVAAGGEVQSGGAEGWAPLERLEATTDPAGGEIDLRNWRRPLILGEADAVAQMVRAQQVSAD